MKVLPKSKKAVKRGGARAGAGRRPVVVYEVWSKIGPWCEDEWRKFAQLKSEERFHEGTVLPARAEMARDKAIARYGLDATKVSEAVQKVFGKRKRGYRNSFTRPYGASKTIIRCAKQHFSEKWKATALADGDTRALGPQITERVVQECWVRWREFEKTIASELKKRV